MAQVLDHGESAVHSVGDEGCILAMDRIECRLRGAFKDTDGGGVFLGKGFEEFDESEFIFVVYWS